MERVILLFGGTSEERLVSVASAQNVASRFARPNCALWFIDPAGAVREASLPELLAHERPFQEPFRPQRPAFAPSIRAAAKELAHGTAFIALHGTEGEDGSLQELFESRGIRFTGAGARASRLCFDKIATKAEVARAGLRVVEQISFTTDAEQVARAALAGLFSRCRDGIVMKPIANGSSVGLRIIDREGDIDEAARAATQAPDKRFMAEPFVRGRELTVGVVDFSGRPEPLPASEIVLEKGHRFDYDGKYLGRGSTEITPAALSPTDAAACQAAAVRAHEALGCYGYSRTDMILCDDGRDPVFLETNTLPGLSRSSFIPQQLRAAGWTLDAFVDRQLELARLRRDLRGSGISQGGATGQP